MFKQTKFKVSFRIDLLMRANSSRSLKYKFELLNDYSNYTAILSNK